MRWERITPTLALQWKDNKPVSLQSDQLLTANNVRRKCYRWWKTLFFHLIDMSIVNAFILFKEYQAKFPDNEDPKRPASYTMAEFREEIVRVFCGFPELTKS